MLQLSTLSIAKRLGILMASAIIGLILLLIFLMVSERNLLLQERQAAVQQTVDVAHGVVAQFHEQFTQGKLPEDEAKQRALASIKALRYNGSDYFWINDLQSSMVMHPISPKLDGHDQSGLTDPTGKHFFVEMVNIVKAQGAGFVYYMWPKPGSDQPVKKVSYVKGFMPWGWVIGSGVYIDTVDTAIIARTLQSSAGLAVLAALMLGIGVLVARSILKQMGGEPGEVNAITHRMAQGDLSVQVHVNPGDESSIMYGIRSMRDNMARIVANVRQGSQGVATASAEIAQGNNDLSARTESQASALQQTAASMDRLGATVRQNADSARQANQLAQNASSVAVQGGDVVAQVVNTMKGINDSSRKIADIISVIDGIAFQTNILALNAAVEAARAGEQGRGFAVVASEVRSLAGRSAEAAKEIKQLITDSVSRVEQGTLLVDKAGTTMTEIVTSIQHVNDIVGEISAASEEQNAGVTQVGQAVTQMDQATQQNAALVEEMAAAASSLQSQSNELVRAVAVFTLGGESSPASYTAAPPTRITAKPTRPASPQLRPPVTKPVALPKAQTAKPRAPAPVKKAVPAPSASGDHDEWESF